MIDIPCPMCLDNPASQKQQCADSGNHECECCTECREACYEEWSDAITRSEEEQLVESDHRD